MRIYTASRFSDYERVRGVNDALRGAGHTVTHDWTRTDEFGPDGHPRTLAEDEASIPLDVAAKHASDDLAAVASADLILFLADGSNYCGALLEVGAALALGKQVWIIAPWRPSIFWALPTATVFQSLDDAMVGLEASLEAAPS